MVAEVQFTNTGVIEGLYRGVVHQHRGDRRVAEV